MELHNKNGSLPKYRMSFTVGGLLYQEAVSTADLYIKLKDWAKVREEILKTNLFQARTINSLEKICREVLSRLKLLSLEQLKIIQDGSRQEQLQILWIAVCKRYSFIRDFAIEVIREKFLLMDYAITEEDYIIFFDTKAEWHEELERLKDSTKKKLKQVLFRILRESEITSEVNIILPSILTKRVARALVSDKSELYIVLPVSDTDFKEWVK
ncbi:MAG: DUF1819 family protein [Desulfobacula sp.]|jgi:hypothetical protein|uniref:DUF1819 family protein n=1 Tax=Desulfobacula sp. TaxID=2593537 RepID=UPI001D85E594|nr:DUF1819 family protein [Desulfobacula sp.]MBT3484106.1 DUF1819 family protein [Desulfobacula sp.]MBT3805238.1 DUF1819 family protein [Desulfobacula sp.]MBT4024571.1 DUF1819 family protein [Desulfobacula sp.]MBT4199887.1 DUF1819 family protein [Desulfobacula sp.]